MKRLNFDETVSVVEDWMSGLYGELFCEVWNYEFADDDGPEDGTYLMTMWEYGGFEENPDDVFYNEEPGFNRDADFVFLVDNEYRSISESSEEFEEMRKHLAETIVREHFSEYGEPDDYIAELLEDGGVQI